MKYLLIALVILASGMLYFMHQSNKASAERLKQAEIAHQQRRMNEKSDAIKNESTKETVSVKSVVEQKVETSGQSGRTVSEKTSVSSGNKYTEQEWLSICKSAAGAARAIMNSRQRGATITDMMDRVVGTAEPELKGIVQAFVVEAYEEPRYNVPENQLKAEIDFENDAYLTCLKARS